MLENDVTMTRRLALGGSALVAAAAVSASGTLAQTSGTALVCQILVSRLKGELRGEDLKALAELMHPAVRTIAWTGSGELDVVGPSAYRESYLTPYLQANPALKISMTKVLTNGTELIAFYDVSAMVDGKPSAWSGCTVYITDGERIVEQWIEQDLWWRSRQSSTVNSGMTAQQIEKNFKPQTTAANLAGMGRFLSYKNTMMPSDRRIAGFVGLLAPDAVQTSWEPEGTIFLADPGIISTKFQDGLLQAIPDFWETVRRAIIIGNMLTLLQVPSGNLAQPGNKKKFCAWYNCDVFFFEGDRIRYILFQRDVMYDQSQTAS